MGAAGMLAPTIAPTARGAAGAALGARRPRCPSQIQCSCSGVSAPGAEHPAAAALRAAAFGSRRAAAALASLGGGAPAPAHPLLLAAAVAPAAAPASLGGALAAGWAAVCGNYVFVVGFWAWFAAQFLKIFTKWYKTGVLTPMAFVDSGGMPSSHSALCSAVTTAVGAAHGLGSPLFAACVCFSVIVMYDAMGVRRHAGLQAEVLNAVVRAAEDLLEGHPLSQRKLKEVLGHTPRQVAAGAVLGVAVGLLFPRGALAAL